MKPDWTRLLRCVDLKSTHCCMFYRRCNGLNGFHKMGKYRRVDWIQCGFFFFIYYFLFSYFMPNSKLFTFENYLSDLYWYTQYRPGSVRRLFHENGLFLKNCNHSVNTEINNDSNWCRILFGFYTISKFQCNHHVNDVSPDHFTLWK